MPQACTLYGISMNIQEEHSARYQVQMEHELTLIMTCVDPLNWRASEVS